MVDQDFYDVSDDSLKLDMNFQHSNYTSNLNSDRRQSFATDMKGIVGSSSAGTLKNMQFSQEKPIGSSNLLEINNNHGSMPTTTHQD